MRWVAALLVLLAGAARADHDVREIHSPAQVRYRIVRDLNADGFDDLLIVSDAEVWRWNGRADGLPRQPDARMKLPAGASLFHVGPLDASKREHFVVRTPKGYLRLRAQAKPQLVAPGGPGLPVRATNVLWRSLFTDLDKDGTPDFIDVSLEGYSIRYGDRRKVLLPPLLTEQANTEVDAASDRLLARFAFADWYDGDFNGDGRLDFALLTPRGLLVYTGDERAGFDPKRSIDIEFPEAEKGDLTLLDLNGDGQTDVLSVEPKSGRATALVADPAKGLAAPKRVRLTVPGEMRNAIISDFNGDGLMDLALPYVPKLSFQDVLRVVARREVMIRVPIFINRGGQEVFPALADNSLSLPVRVRVKTDSIGRLLLGGLVVVEYEGDLDGDGRRDLLVTDTATRLALHRGSPTKVFFEKPSRHIRIPDCSEFESVKSKAADVNGDRTSDILLHYRGGGRRPDRLFVLLSRK